MTLLDARRIRSLLHEFVSRLGDTGESYDGVVIGGAALILEAIPDRSATQDVDTFGELSDAAKEIVADIGRREDLPPDWLNRRAQMFMSPIADTSRLVVLFEHQNVRLRLMDKPTLLALKLRAGRIDKDGDDIRELLDQLDISSLADAKNLVDDYWGGEEEMGANSEQIVRLYLAQRTTD